jgi:hypothetical protein
MFIIISDSDSKQVPIFFQPLVQLNLQFCFQKYLQIILKGVISQITEFFLPPNSKPFFFVFFHSYKCIQKAIDFSHNENSKRNASNKLPKILRPLCTSAFIFLLFLWLHIFISWNFNPLKHNCYYMYHLILH